MTQSGRHSLNICTARWPSVASPQDRRPNDVIVVGKQDPDGYVVTVIVTFDALVEKGSRASGKYCMNKATACVVQTAASMTRKEKTYVPELITAPPIPLGTRE